MAKQIADVQIHASDELEDDNLDVSVDLIDDGLYLGNLACARDSKTLEQLKITHILTIDLVPLPRSILERSTLTFKYIKLADVPKEDLISHLPESNDFIKQAVASGGTVLVHCYFGVSRSAAFVIAYVMEKYSLCYEDAFLLVKAKRRFIGPNVGFVAQLKLFGHMGYTINRDDPRFKQFRLKMAGQKLKQVKILPQLFADLVKPDPGLIRERPDPIVYRCKKCRRIVASQSNIIPHLPKQVKIDLAKKNIRPPPSKLTGLTCAENGQLLIEKLKSLACQIMDTSAEREDSSDDSAGKSCPASEEGPSQVLDGYSENNMVDASIVPRDAPEICRLMWFVEPMSWMKDVPRCPQGKLHCPKCQNKIGSFSWVMGCKCPCGQKVAPAFYLVPSKVEWSNIVQNVQVTV
ncbi:dual specificity protein phosphatase MPK-4-like [Maniola jurtina]|uniref:dual specificity protein phosphatase MPK-4-like n=1 Tax=Maniola jurtina TaxID=191418 RepID=UPI001E6896C7|nr:dual specificity protein phosphatase MPK-4-like [Maniola jurtina]XP_045761552.1 dual specificity protein phosphatase MPK-4-like [Maniola jurtina]XP_045761553.1 dual specificity protein phosphatase MPK-4-like [Maniola jurtina]XP_045761554.1 dual specificity protein phosphatase MPK-4-like [Maniola jurtina]